MKLEVGQKVYLEPTGFDHHQKEQIVETFITKVGRKYIELDGHRNKFSIETLHEVSLYSPSWTLYFSKQALEEKIERQKAIWKLRNMFDHYSNASDKLSLQQLRDMLKIATQTEGS